MANTLKEFEKLLHLAPRPQGYAAQEVNDVSALFDTGSFRYSFAALTAIGGPLKAEPQIAQAMESQLHTTYDKVSEEMETYTGYSLQLSRELERDIEDFLDEKECQSRI